jgi:hypothetical protein
MKALTEKKIKALAMRKSGMSYSQIKKRLEVSKSSLSLWLRHLPLSNERVRELRDINEQRIERFRNTMATKVQNRLKEVYKQEQTQLLPLSDKELMLTGLFLYWGEGAKTKRFEISLSNTNPRMIKFYIHWLIKAFQVPTAKMVIRLQLYADMSVKKEQQYWSDILGLPTTQFSKPYIKKTTLRGLTFKGHGHGTCNLIVPGRDYYEIITQGIDVIVDDCIGVT